MREGSKDQPRRFTIEVERGAGVPPEGGGRAALGDRAAQGGQDGLGHMTGDDDRDDRGHPEQGRYGQRVGVRRRVLDPVETAVVELP